MFLIPRPLPRGATYIPDNLMAILGIPLSFQIHPFQNLEGQAACVRARKDRLTVVLERYFSHTSFTLNWVGRFAALSLLVVHTYKNCRGISFLSLGGVGQHQTKQRPHEIGTPFGFPKLYFFFPFILAQVS